MDWLAFLKDQYKHGVVRSSLDYESIVAAATSVTLYTLSTGKTAFLLSLTASNRAADSILTVGSGNFTQLIPDLNVLGGTVQPNHFTLDNGLPLKQFETNIVGRASVAAADPNDIKVQCSVFEF